MPMRRSSARLDNQPKPMPSHLNPDTSLVARVELSPNLRSTRRRAGREASSVRVSDPVEYLDGHHDLVCG